jgi:hypothetical protein
MPAIATAQICPFEDDTLEEACNRMAELEKKLPNERRKMSMIFDRSSMGLRNKGRSGVGNH